MRTVLFLCLVGVASAQDGYRKAPPAVRKVLDLPPQPTAVLAPDGKTLLLAEGRSYPPVAELARPHLRLAGLRFDPVAHGPHVPRLYSTYRLVPTDGGKRIAIDPPGGKGSLPEFSPDGSRFAFTCPADAGNLLFVADTATGTVRPVEKLRLNAVLADAVRWMPGGKGLLVTALTPEGRVPMARPLLGPAIQESTGKAAPVRTYQDLLQNKGDEALFEHHVTSQLVVVDADTLAVTPIGSAAMIAAASPSPDGKFLLVTTLQKPFSYSHPVSAFPRLVQVWDAAGKTVHKVTDVPLADRVPLEGVPTRPRLVAWRPDAAATLVWAEALDGGDPARKAGFRDVIKTFAAPFAGPSAELMKTQHRLTGVQWTEGGTALVTEYDRDKRRRRVWRVEPGAKPVSVWDLAVQDRIGDPGTPLTRVLPSGHSAVRQYGGAIYLVGEGAAREATRPFLDRFDLATGKATRLFQSDADAYDRPIDVLDAGGARFLTRHETTASPPNYRVHAKDGVRALTTFVDLVPELRQITRRLIVYKRDDGVILSSTVYTPPGWKEGTRLPTLLWAYPREFNDAALAGQTVGVPRRYTALSGASHLFALLAGYAVIESSMPVVGSVETANDTFVDQVVMNAKAAVNKAVEAGYTDGGRVAVGGHSYGAFMTANLLAHSDLFRAGVARSGAYNRTLTPFGFQNERRTFWQAPEVYAKMSPFMHAHKIKTPILLIHGADDNNPGTFPIQSDRLFQAIKGNGGTARFVSLPYESHGYAGRESVEHAVAEMIGWLDQHLKEPSGKKVD